MKEEKDVASHRGGHGLRDGTAVEGRNAFLLEAGPDLLHALLPALHL